MCGIVGYISVEEKLNLSDFMKMIKSLDYRGYDSWGISHLADKITIVKELGKITNTDLPGKSNLILGHTRWATHGGVTKENAHPHLSNDKTISLVHNGIIENYQELKKELSGFTFEGQTDTEVLTNYIQSKLNGDTLTSFEKVLPKLEGTYAIGFLKTGENRIYFARKDSPLVLGIGENENFLSSDVTSFFDRTKTVIYLEDGDYGYIEGKTVKIFNSGSEVDRKKSTITWDIDKAKKGDFEHFMLKEISEQVDTVKQSLIQDKNTILSIVDDLKKKKIYMVACGTSYNAALSAEYEFLEKGIMPKVIRAHEFRNYSKFIDKNSLILAISQSGETFDLIDALKSVKDSGAEIVSIVNVQGSTLDRMSDKRIYMNVGPEICVLSTKSYTAQVSILMLLAGCLNDTYKNSKEDLDDIVRHIYYLTSENARKYTKDLSHLLRYTKHLFTIGRRRDYPTAMEAALKIKEVSYIHAEGFAGGQIKHGPIAMIENGTPCIVFVPNENNSDILSNAQELKSRGAFIIGISDKEHEVFDFWIKVIGPDKYSPILRIIPIQALSYYLAVLKGLDPDKPRNLAKSVTVK